MPITLQNTTITGLSAGGLPNDTITAANMATNGGWAPAGALIATSVIRNGTRRSVAGAASAILYSGTFTKLRADTVIIAVHTTFGASYSAGNCGMGMQLNSTWDYGTAYQYDAGWTQGNQTTIIYGTGRWTSVPAGSNTMGVGWNTVNNQAGNTPFNIFNPNSSDDGRNQQMISQITIYEVAP